MAKDTVEIKNRIKPISGDLEEFNKRLKVEISLVKAHKREKKILKTLIYSIL